MAPPRFTRRTPTLDQPPGPDPRACAVLADLAASELAQRGIPVTEVSCGAGGVLVSLASDADLPAPLCQRLRSFEQAAGLPLRLERPGGPVDLHPASARPVRDLPRPAFALLAGTLAQTELAGLGIEVEGVQSSRAEPRDAPARGRAPPDPRGAGRAGPRGAAPRRPVRGGVAAPREAAPPARGPRPRGGHARSGQVGAAAPRALAWRP